MTIFYFSGMLFGWWQFNIWFLFMAVYVDMYLIANNKEVTNG